MIRTKSNLAIIMALLLSPAILLCMDKDDISLMSNAEKEECYPWSLLFECRTRIAQDFWYFISPLIVVDKFTCKKQQELNYKTDIIFIKEKLNLYRELSSSINKLIDINSLSDLTVGMAPDGGYHTGFITFHTKTEVKAQEIIQHLEPFLKLGDEKYVKYHIYLISEAIKDPLRVITEDEAIKTLINDKECCILF